MSCVIVYLAVFPSSSWILVIMPQLASLFSTLHVPEPEGLSKRLAFAALAGLCLKWPTTFLHLATTLSNALLCRDTVTERWRLCATQGTFSKGRCLAAAIIFLASVLL
ncbi:hypothetical protein F2P79_009152 [Pimephales promelas]|nr:hypothetical protein F2P79_009152 [Pimephales promelas]